MHFKVMISLAFAFKVVVLHMCGATCILKKDYLSICLQSNIFVHMWCQMHFKVTISLAFAFKVVVLHMCGATCILKERLSEHLASK